MYRLYIPIHIHIYVSPAPDITQLSQTLTVSRIALSSNGATEVDVTFAVSIHVCW